MTTATELSDWDKVLLEWEAQMERDYASKTTFGHP